MAARLTELVNQIRDDMGPFFVSRLYLRRAIPPDDDTPDDPTLMQTLVDACLELGYDPRRRERIRQK